MAQLAAKIDAEARRAGCTIPFSDLLIGVTALHFGYAIGTRNLRHFRMVPNLVVNPALKPRSHAEVCRTTFTSIRGGIEPRLASHPNENRLYQPKGRTEISACHLFAGRGGECYTIVQTS
jgi:hypothetical protein